MSLAVERFKPETLFNDFFRMVLVAPSTYGKSYYLLYLLTHFLIKEYKFIFMISSIKNPIYNKVIWPNHYYIVDNKEQLDEIVASILDFGNKLKDSLSRHKKVLILFDDLGWLTKNSDEISNLFIRGRNSYCSTVMCVQSCQMIARCLRWNITHTGIFCYSEELGNYLSALAITQTKKSALNRIERIFTSLKERDVSRPIVMLNLISREPFTWTNIPSLEQPVTELNILALQYSKLQVKTDIPDDNIYI